MTDYMGSVNGPFRAARELDLPSAAQLQQMLAGGHHQELAAAAATIVDGVVPVLESSFANQVEFSVPCRPDPAHLAHASPTAPSFQKKYCSISCQDLFLRPALSADQGHSFLPYDDHMCIPAVAQPTGRP